MSVTSRCCSKTSGRIVLIFGSDCHRGFLRPRSVYTVLYGDSSIFRITVLPSGSLSQNFGVRKFLLLQNDRCREQSLWFLGLGAPPPLSSIPFPLPPPFALEVVPLPSPLPCLSLPSYLPSLPLELGPLRSS